LHTNTDTINLRKIQVINCFLCFRLRFKGNIRTSLGNVTPLIEEKINESDFSEFTKYFLQVLSVCGASKF